ncbi:SUMF1/EgtB/PvdO family nonheme iron enzyme [Rhizobium sp.]|uniref:formylglycine-generating enzyme family protein n=1 Tax=Rhizobium sp. TaxID=391 RepID=UPI002AA675DB
MREFFGEIPNACVNLRSAVEARMALISSQNQRVRSIPTSRSGHRVQPQTPKPQRLALGPGTIIKDCPECPSMIVVPSGTFEMGSDPSEAGRSSDEGPRIEVSIKSVAVGRFEITFDEWDSCVRDSGCNGYSPSDAGWGRGNRPAIFVSWADAVTYTQWLSTRTHQKYRLLSEAEWEYIARGAGTLPLSHNGLPAAEDIQTSQVYGFLGPPSDICKFGNVADSASWYPKRITDCSDGWGNQTAPVGSFRPNALGIYDLIGNVSEWVLDCYHDSLIDESPRGAPYLRADCAAHVARGGAWGLWRLHDSAYDENRIAARFGSPDSYLHGGNGDGFRVAREVNQ